MDSFPQLIWLQAFVAVAENQGFTRAAWNTGLSTMLLSKRCRQLEAHIGKSLFHRTTRRVELTEFGQAYLPQCCALLEQAQNLGEWVAASGDEPVGQLRLAVEPQFLQHFLAENLPRFQTSYPKVNLSVMSWTSLIDTEINDLDLAVGFSEYLGRRFERLKRKLLFNIDSCILAAPDYLAQFGTPQIPTDLESHRMIGDGMSQPSNLLMVAEGPHQYDLTGLSFAKPLLHAESNDAATRLKMAIAGQGLLHGSYAQGFGMPQPVAQALEEGTLVEVLPQYRLKGWANYLYINPSKSDLPRVRAFVGFLEQVLSEKRVPGA